jgi:hypothetical protein
LTGDLSQSGGTGTAVTITGTPSVSGSDDDVTEGSLRIETATTTVTGNRIASGYTNTANLIANPQIYNDTGNLSIKYECRVVFVVAAKTYTAAKEISTISV